MEQLGARAGFTEGGAEKGAAAAEAAVDRAETFVRQHGEGFLLALKQEGWDVDHVYIEDFPARIEDLTEKYSG